LCTRTPRQAKPGEQRRVGLGVSSQSSKPGTGTGTGTRAVTRAGTGNRNRNRNRNRNSGHKQTRKAGTGSARRATPFEPVYAHTCARSLLSAATIHVCIEHEMVNYRRHTLHMSTPIVIIIIITFMLAGQSG
jgi:hypothetical protein